MMATTYPACSLFHCSGEEILLPHLVVHSLHTETQFPWIWGHLLFPFSNQISLPTFSAFSCTPSLSPILFFISSQSFWNGNNFSLYFTPTIKQEKEGRRQRMKKQGRLLEIHPSKDNEEVEANNSKEVNVATLLVGEGQCSTAGQDRGPYQCATFGRCRFQFSFTVLKIILSLPLTTEKHLTWENRNPVKCWHYTLFLEYVAV